jgi:hypothetical protein
MRGDERKVVGCTVKGKEDHCSLGEAGPIAWMAGCLGFRRTFVKKNAEIYSHELF